MLSSVYLKNNTLKHLGPLSYTVHYSLKSNNVMWKLYYFIEHQLHLKFDERNVWGGFNS
jgi:hypothetical protein